MGQANDPNCHCFSLRAVSKDSCIKCGFDGHNEHDCKNIVRESEPRYFYNLRDADKFEHWGIGDDCDGITSFRANRWPEICKKFNLGDVPLPQIYSWICVKCRNSYCVDFRRFQQ
jgi:hypothetical protein